MCPPESGGDRPALEVWLNQLADRLIAGESLDRETAQQLTEIEGTENILLLCAAADRVRQECCGNVVDLCSIVNVKSGSCSENCGFCSQSAHHPGEDSPIYGLKSPEEILAQPSQRNWRGRNAFVWYLKVVGLNIAVPNLKSLSKF